MILQSENELWNFQINVSAAVGLSMLGGQVVVTVISALFLRRLPLTFSQKWLFLG